MMTIQAKMNGLKFVKTTLSINFSANSAIGGGIRPNFKLILGFMTVLVPCKNEKDSIKTEAATALTKFSQL